MTEPSERAGGPTVDADAFWRAGPLPPAGEPGEPAPGLRAVGRPEITVDGRDLADVLRPAYDAMPGAPAG